MRARSALRRLGIAAVTAATVTAFALTGPGPQAVHHTVIAVNANQSGNWSGYNVGSLASGNTLFTSILGQWRVPTATPRSRTDSEFSSNWIGIGGGCVNADCSVSDPATLIQAGTEQDVINGAASYSAWWEIIPAPATTIAGFTVRPGDLMSSSIVQTAPGTWTIRLLDITRHETFQTTVPYASSELSAEWITETPVVVNGTGTGVATMPNLRADGFDNAWLNGKPVRFTPAEQMQLSPSGGGVVATPSGPDRERDGFAICTYATRCAAPASS